MKKNPYENNEYLKDNKELLKEMLFFEKFGIPMEEEPKKKDEQEEDEKDL